MKVCIIGGTGCIGKSLAPELASRGLRVSVLSRNTEDDPAVERSPSINEDVTEYDSIQGAFSGQNAVINLVVHSQLFTPGGFETLLNSSVDDEPLQTESEFQETNDDRNRLPFSSGESNRRI